MEDKVFINCPFDSDYKEFLRIIVFICLHAGLEPCLTLNDENNVPNRIDKIYTHIIESRYSIHDLCRCKCECRDEPDGSVREEYYRMNMPFELGLDWSYARSNPALNKQILVLEGNKYESQRALSDISNLDPKSHHYKQEQLFSEVRDWLYNRQFKTIPSAIVLEDSYLDFLISITKQIANKYNKMHLSSVNKIISDMKIYEIIEYMRDWLSAD